MKFCPNHGYQELTYYISVEINKYTNEPTINVHTCTVKYKKVKKRIEMK